MRKCRQYWQSTIVMTADWSNYSVINIYYTGSMLATSIMATNMTFCTVQQSSKPSQVSLLKVKVKADVLYSATSRESLASERSDMDHTVLPALRTISAFNSVSSPRRRHHAYMHSSECLRSIYYSFIDPKRMNGWVGHVGLHTVDGLPPEEVTRQLHVMAQATESKINILTSVLQQSLHNGQKR